LEKAKIGRIGMKRMIETMQKKEVKIWV